MSVGAIADHLWQSTWFALVAVILAMLVRKDAARIRYWIWFGASAKFLLPFAVLTWIGGQFIFQTTAEDALLSYVQTAVLPLTQAAIVIEPLSLERQEVLIALWGFGSFALLLRLAAHWWRARRLLDRAHPCDIRAPIPVRQSSEIHEPCVIGMFDPVLLWPAKLSGQLTERQIEAVIAHETSHARRRDNLTATLHGLVTAAFWFHPLVWWLGGKLLETREHACDEAALEEGHEPRIYAEAILRICRHSVQERIACVARASGGALSARIRCIMSGRPRLRLVHVRRAIACAALLGCMTLPVAAGMNVVSIATLRVAAGTQSMRIAASSEISFISASDDHVYARNISLRELIGHAYGVSARDVAGPYDWLDTPRYDIDLRSADGVNDARRLVADLLERELDIELIVRPTIVPRRL